MIADDRLLGRALDVEAAVADEPDGPVLAAAQQQVVDAPGAVGSHLVAIHEAEAAAVTRLGAALGG